MHSQASEVLDLRTPTCHHCPFVISRSSSGPAECEEIASGGQGAGPGSDTSTTVPRYLRESGQFTHETTHSPEDYGHGHFSIWTQVLLTPAKKENIKSSYPRFRYSVWAQRGEKPSL